jgi:diguanylate cyclase (GGDEF)-like protein
VRNPRAFGTTRLLLAVLAVDTLRNIFENTYFGLYFGSEYGLLSPTLRSVLGHPVLLVVPKILNVIAAVVVLSLLSWRWLPLAVKECGAAEQHASDLEALASIDWLTGIYNRRQFEALAYAEVARCQRYLRPMSILMIDVDNFKTINDRFGHAVGDRVLQAIGALLGTAKRESDVAARVGGDEFAFLLPETTEGPAELFAERLRQQVCEYCAAVDGIKLNVGISIGVASSTFNQPTLERLLRRADAALYEAKGAGRNRVAVSRSPIQSPTRIAAA